MPYINHNELSVKYWLDGGKLRLLQLATRQRGLMTLADNPRHLARLEDSGQRSLRFINRQKDSGTRIIFDALLYQVIWQPIPVKIFQLKKC